MNDSSQHLAVTNHSVQTFFCEYMHSKENVFSLWVDGPCTCFAAMFSVVGTCFAIRFLRNARLNKTMSAALYTLCLVDFMLMTTTVLFLSFEACSILFFNSNFMFDKQPIILTLYGIRNSFAMSSTMLVIYITFIRFRVVSHPLKFASNFNRSRKSIAATEKLSTAGQSLDTPKCSQSFQPSDVIRDSYSNSNNMKNTVDLRKFLRPFTLPILVVIFCFISHCTSYFEFMIVSCFDNLNGVYSTMLFPSKLRMNQSYIKGKAIFTSMTETIGPMFVISVLSLFTEYRIHVNIQARRRLFESQKRNRNALVTEELRDKASKALAVFIVVKFLILRSLPTVIDLYEVTIKTSREFGSFMEILTRISDFLVALNSATNTLAYFGKNRFEMCFSWLERRIRGKYIRKETKQILHTSFSA